MVFFKFLQPGINFRISDPSDPRVSYNYHNHPEHFSPSPAIDQQFFQSKPGVFSPNPPQTVHHHQIPLHHHQETQDHHLHQGSNRGNSKFPDFSPNIELQVI